MHESLSASVPKRLRLQASVQFQQVRLPLKSFLYCAGLIVFGGLLIIISGNLVGVLKVILPALLIGLVILEGKWWGGRRSWECAQIIVRYAQRSRTLRMEPQYIFPAGDGETMAAIRKPRWSASEAADESAPAQVQGTI